MSSLIVFPVYIVYLFSTLLNSWLICHDVLGVTCLFIAAKIEEIYPPKLQEFAFVTDGACSEDEIIQMELVVLKGLNWGLSPMTPNRWMKTYMQVTKNVLERSLVVLKFYYLGKFSSNRKWKSLFFQFRLTISKTLRAQENIQTPSMMQVTTLWFLNTRTKSSFRQCNY